MTSENTELLRAAIAALHALRSYQYGNSSPDLAEEIAYVLDKAIIAALGSRDRYLSELQTMLAVLETELVRGSIRASVESAPPGDQ